MFSMSKTTRAAVAGALALTGAAAMTAGEALADRYNRQVVVINHNDSPLMYLYATNTGSNVWGYDHLGQYRVDPGYQIVVDLNDFSGYCRFDIRAEFADGSVAEDWGVNVCEVGQITYY